MFLMLALLLVCSVIVSILFVMVIGLFRKKKYTNLDKEESYFK